MVECLTPLACRDVCHQLVLNLRDQYLGQLALEKETKMHFDEDLPPMVRRPSPHPQPLVQGMLDVVCPMHLRDNLPRGREFSVGDPDFRFAITGSEGSRESRRRRYHFLFDYSSRGNPHPHNLEGLRKVSDIIGQLPRGIDALPVQYVSLGKRNQQKILYPKR